ncbi:MAG TPA: crosslink repair DNA glycosylase YcaQ family protein [Acidimicrobiia bacterium]|nr:crosslink repair DNA glycosylase YcaQ family protein [Acidimicrobiia bacterium]
MTRLVAETLRRVARAGLQDSMPRAAVLFIHARVQSTHPTIVEDASLVQLWGPRFSVYAVAAEDRAVFTLGRLPMDRRRRARAVDLADRLEDLLGGGAMPFGEAGSALGEQPKQLRYAAPTGRVLLRWDGARQPTVWIAAPPRDDPDWARLELARRYLHTRGPATADDFSQWAGINRTAAAATFDALADSLIPVVTPFGEADVLAADEDALAGRSGRPARVRLLPSGDTYTLLQGRQRELLVADAERRKEVWPSRVWPGTVLVDGEVVGTWRRADRTVTFDVWQHLTSDTRKVGRGRGDVAPHSRQSTDDGALGQLRSTRVGTVGVSVAASLAFHAMDVAGLGIDLAEVPRVRRLLQTYGERFKARCFTDHEWEYAHRYVDPSARLAARFAGKEAVMKSLGAGWRRIHWKDIEITGGGAPRVNLSGTAQRRADMIGVVRVLVTITHTDDQAMVFAMSFRDSAASSG